MAKADFFMHRTIHRLCGRAAVGILCAGMGLVLCVLAAHADADPNAPDAGDAAAPATAPTTEPTLTLINLHMKQAMPEDVFNAIARQAGVRFSPNGNLWDQDNMQTALDVDLSNRPFWPAVMDVCQMWDLAVQSNNYGPQSGGGAVRLQLLERSQMGQNGSAPLPECETDGVLIQAVSLQRNMSVDYANPDRRQNNCSLQLRVYVDPAIRVQNMNNMAHVQEAEDELGHSMVITDNNNFGGGFGGQGRMVVFDCQVPLKYPDGAGKTIAHLKGYLTARVIQGIDTMTVDAPLTAGETDKTVGDTTIMFHSLTKTPQGYELKLSVSRDEDSDNNNNDYWSLLNGATLTDASGHNFLNGGGGGGGGENGVADYTLNYQNQSNNGGALGDPAKWTLEVPLKTRSMRIPIDLHDLPLPGE